MVEVETIEIDNKKYIIAGKIDNYIYLVNADNPKEFCIKKEVLQNNETYIAPIESREEFNKALELFSKESDV